MTDESQTTKRKKMITETQRIKTAFEHADKVLALEDPRTFIANCWLENDFRRKP